MTNENEITETGFEQMCAFLISGAFLGVGLGLVLLQVIGWI